ncbi:MAG: Xaa-Pro peptidase family protein [Kiritimatiellae bacterium]|nr:Xaa-Pro peptidase family protein [Kiritimatiellia bacterium]MDD4736089.1 Xaa-Pro peptidase family protein [Kiritimatiellia bacterium]
MNTSNTLVHKEELSHRLSRLRGRLDLDHPEWRCAAFLGRINLYYLTGTMQNGLLLLPRDGEAVFWVKRSYARACEESTFPNIRPMASFRDTAHDAASYGDTILLEMETVPLALYTRFNKAFGFHRTESLDGSIAAVRSVKSDYELALLRQAGAIHRAVLEDDLPPLLREGMSEAELAADVFHALLQRGHHAISRVHAFNSELMLGQVCFGESALYGNPFTSPGGVRGIGPSAPFFGSPDRLLRPGDMVSVDTGCNIQGYHSDKTVTMVFQGGFSPEAERAHQTCLEIERRTAERLRPGQIPSIIYKEILADLEPDFLAGFMGSGAEQVRFLGHGVGLEIDEYPVIAKGFDEPLEANMVMALEPKAWIPEQGMVGTENTFVITPEGGICITQ